MAKNDTNTNAPVPPAAAAASTRKPGRPRGPHATDSLSWNDERLAALTDLLLDHQAPGTLLTTKQIADQLADHPAFAGDYHLLKDDNAPEKIRQRVKKLQAAAAKLGLGELKVKSLGGGGSDVEETLRAAFARREKQLQEQMAVPSTTTTFPPSGAGLIPIVGGGQ